MENFKREALERMARFIIDHGEGKCTGWSGGRDQDGYPMFWFEGKTQRASRVLWELVYGPIPEGLIVRHTCDNVECLLLQHFLLGTHKDNTADALSRGRMTGPRKVDKVMVDKINCMRETMTVKAIADNLGISQSSVYTYLDRRHIREGGYWTKEN